MNCTGKFMVSPYYVPKIMGHFDFAAFVQKISPSAVTPNRSCMGFVAFDNFSLNNATK